MINRNLLPIVRDALTQRAIVTIQGPRHAGKTTLVRALAEFGHEAHYVSLDDLSTLSSAMGDPVGFVAGLGPHAIIEEIEKVPALLPVIRDAVTRDRSPGQFILTASLVPASLPPFDDLAPGDVASFSLWPMSHGEINAQVDGFVDALFGDVAPATSTSSESLDGLYDILLQGGFPEVQQRTRSDRRDAWFDSYLNNVVQHDVRSLTAIEGIRDVPRLLTALASRVGSMLNASDASRDADMAHMTFRRYLALLQAVFLVHPVPAWQSARFKRMAKMEKLYFADYGLLAHLLDVTTARLRKDTKSREALIENLVAMELTKQLTWSATQAGLFHLREHAGLEVDFVLDGGSRVVGLEVCCRASVEPNDFKGLRKMAEVLGDTFHRGIVLYTGAEVQAIDQKLFAVPISHLWTTTMAPAAFVDSVPWDVTIEGGEEPEDIAEVDEVQYEEAIYEDEPAVIPYVAVAHEEVVYEDEPLAEPPREEALEEEPDYVEDLADSPEPVVEEIDDEPRYVPIEDVEQNVVPDEDERASQMELF